MKIARVARVKGLTSKTIRYYDSIGLIVAGRSDNGYRVYSEFQVRELAFVQKARTPSNWRLVSRPSGTPFFSE